MITRCVCHEVTFSELLEAAKRSGARTLEELMAHVAFGRKCTLCHPYVRRMLAGGKTEFPAGEFASPVPRCRGVEARTPARRSSGRAGGSRSKR